jgi:hypothetical protein
LGLLLLPATLFAQDRQITGRVTRASGGTPVVDAEVAVVGNPRYAPVRTNAEGRFTVRARRAIPAWRSARSGLPSRGTGGRE